MSFNHEQRRPADLAAAYGSDVDAGLQAHMRRVYNTMCVGLGITGITAYAVASIPALASVFLTPPMFYVAAFAPLAFLWFGFSPTRLARMSAGEATRMFAIFSGIMGLSMATIFIVFTHESIARVFFITAGTFAATSLYGYTTKRDLTKMGSFMFMGMIGIFFASLINMFFHSAAVHFAVSIIGVVVFTGLAAWDTQYIKESYRYNASDDSENNRLAIAGALRMYLNFINLFQSLLHLFGDRR
ncbi:MAG: Bax inhibitor-1 family protein [Alphaproteobacteria bacterium]